MKKENNPMESTEKRMDACLEKKAYSYQYFPYDKLHPSFSPKDNSKKNTGPRKNIQWYDF
jgi:hypothetical protein